LAVSFKMICSAASVCVQACNVRSQLRVCKLSKQEAEAFYDVHRGKPFFGRLVDFMSSGRVCALELMAAGAIQKWRQVCAQGTCLVPSQVTKV
jgi:nucleoside diphosphate kinase